MKILMILTMIGILIGATFKICEILMMDN